jgi:hypothetical protein
MSRSIDAATTEQCMREFDARLDERIERAQALYDAEARGETVEWPADLADVTPQFCPVCQVEVSSGAMVDDSEKLGDLPVWIMETRAVACSPEHDRLWLRMQEYRGALDYRRCFYCQRTFTGSVKPVAIYTWPELSAVATEDHVEHWKNFKNARDPYWAFRVQHGYGPGRYWMKHEPEKAWRTVDLCSEACLDGYVYHCPEKRDFSDVQYVKKPAGPLLTGTRSVDKTADAILCALAGAIKGLAVAEIERQTNLPRTTIQSTMERLRKEGKVTGGGKRQPWLRVVGGE